MSFLDDIRAGKQLKKVPDGEKKDRSTLDSTNKPGDVAASRTSAGPPGGGGAAPRPGVGGAGGIAAQLENLFGGGVPILKSPQPAPSAAQAAPQAPQTLQRPTSHKPAPPPPPPPVPSDTEGSVNRFGAIPNTNSHIPPPPPLPNLPPVPAIAVCKPSITTDRLTSPNVSSNYHILMVKPTGKKNNVNTTNRIMYPSGNYHAGAPPLDVTKTSQPNSTPRSGPPPPPPPMRVRSNNRSQRSGSSGQSALLDGSPNGKSKLIHISSQRTAPPPPPLAPPPPPPPPPPHGSAAAPNGPINHGHHPPPPLPPTGTGAPQTGTFKANLQSTESFGTRFPFLSDDQLPAPPLAYTGPRTYRATPPGPRRPAPMAPTMS